MQSPSTLLVVRDLSVSKLFYIDVLGLKLIEEHNNCLKLKIGDHEVFMFQSGQDSVKYEHGKHSNSTLVFTVKNLDDKIIELKSKGIIFVHLTPNQNIWGRYAAFKDPSGIIHEIMEYHDTQYIQE
jgi:catechol 2,3-dioxygenase-like lactoylglutathione lyase family enzyme